MASLFPIYQADQKQDQPQAAPDASSAQPQFSSFNHATFAQAQSQVQHQRRTQAQANSVIGALQFLTMCNDLQKLVQEGGWAAAAAQHFASSSSEDEEGLPTERSEKHKGRQALLHSCFRALRAHVCLTSPVHAGQRSTGDTSASATSAQRKRR